MLVPLSMVFALAAPASDGEGKVKAIFEDSCTACHGEGGDEVSLEVAPSRLVSVKSKATGKPLVVAGDPDASYLYQKVIGAKGITGDSMPPGDSVNAAQKKAIKDWIAGLKPAAATPAATPTPTPTGDKGAKPAGEQVTLRAPTVEPKVRKIFEEKCVACHDSGGEEVVLAGDLGQLTKIKSKETGKPMVVAGDVEASYLVNKLTGKGMKGEQMPMGDDPLPPAEMEAVRDWIAALGEDEKAKAAAAAAGTQVVEPPPVEPPPVEPPKDGADDGEPKKVKGKAPFYGVFQVQLPTTATLGRRTFEFRIDHRFGQVGSERGAFGLDAGANISYGFAYGILDGWDVLIRRSNSRKGYELGTKYVPIRQEDGYKLSFGGYASVEYLRDFPSNTANPWAGNFQLLLSRLWFDRWSTMLVLGYHLRTNHAPNVQVDLPDDGIAGPVKVRDKRGTLGIGIASTVWLGAKKRWGIDLEYHLPIPADVFFYRGGNADPNGSNIGSWSIGGSIKTGLHFFQIFITNTREIHTTLYAPGGQTKNPFTDRGNFFFGFNLSRKWSL
jgi:mono/diheme cytochrome c family protein